MESKEIYESREDYPDVMGIKLAAKYLGMHPMTLYPLARAKKVPCGRLSKGGAWKFKKVLLDESRESI